MTQIPYKLNKTLAGKIRVKYVCPGCQSALESDLSEAGNSDACPDCGVAFLVPGIEKRQQLQKQLRDQAERRKQLESDAGHQESVAAEPAVNEALTDEQRAEAWDKYLHTPAKIDYPRLTACIILLYIVGVLLGLAGIGGIVLGSLLGSLGGNDNLVGRQFGQVLVCFAVSFFCFLVGQLTHLLIDMRQDVAKLVQKR